MNPPSRNAVSRFLQNHLAKIVAENSPLRLLHAQNPMVPILIQSALTKALFAAESASFHDAVAVAVVGGMRSLLCTPPCPQSCLRRWAGTNLMAQAFGHKISAALVTARQPWIRLNSEGPTPPLPHSQAVCEQARRRRAECKVQEVGRAAALAAFFLWLVPTVKSPGGVNICMQVK